MESSYVLAVSFVIYTLAIIVTGLYSTRLRKRTEADFVLANRELGPWVSALSASAPCEPTTGNHGPDYSNTRRPS